MEHCFPPDKGFGDEHVLDLFWVPPPQNLLQELNLLQDDQPPLAKIKNKILFGYLID